MLVETTTIVWIEVVEFWIGIRIVSAEGDSVTVELGLWVFSKVISTTSVG